MCVCGERCPMKVAYRPKQALPLRSKVALRRCATIVLYDVALRSCSTVMVCDVAQPHQRSPKLVAHASGLEARSTVIGVAWPHAAQPAASAPIVYRTQVRPRQPQCTSGAPKSPAASHIDRTSLAALACRCSRLGHAVQLSCSHATQAGHAKRWLRRHRLSFGPSARPAAARAPPYGAGAGFEARSP